MIYMTLPSVPPSVNSMYMTVVKGRGKGRATIRTLTKKGRAYKNEAKAYLAQNFQGELLKFEKNKPYLLFIRFHFVGTHTKGWPKDAQSRYKKLDVTNYLKAFEDVLSDVTGVDDSHNFVVVAHKVDDSEPMTEVWAWEMGKEETPFDEALFTL